LTVGDNAVFSTASSTGIVKFSQINSDTGAVSFGNENLSTTGTLSITGLTTLGNASTTLLSISNIGYIGGNNGLVLSDGSILDTSGTISFGDENLTTTGTLNISGLTTLGNASTTLLSVSGNTYLATTTLSGNLTVNGEPFDRASLVPLLTQTSNTPNPKANNISIDTTYSPQSVAFDGRYIWVNSATSNNLTKIDPQTNPPSILTVISDIGPYTWNPTFDGTSMWVSAPTDTNVTSIVWKVNATTNAVSGPFTVGLAPRGKAFDGTYMWVANWGDGSISKINVTTNAVTTPITGLTGVYELAFDGTYMWAVSTSANTITKIDYLTNTIMATIPVGNYPSKVAFDGTHIWVSLRDDGTVQVINRSTDGIEDTISVGTRPRWLSFDGKYMWVVCRDSSNIYTIDVKTRSIHSIINVGNLSNGSGAYPFGAAFDGESMWVINNGGATGDGLPDVVRYSTDEGFLSHSLGEFALTVSSPGTNNDFDTGNEVCRQLIKTCAEVYYFIVGAGTQATSTCATADPNSGAKFYAECK
jgi:YVTN family beta-propeller protein